MIAFFDLWQRFSPALFVLWLMIYLHRRVERRMRAQQHECERLVDAIRRIDPRAAENLAEVVTPTTSPKEPKAPLPTARVIRL